MVVKRVKVIHELLIVFHSNVVLHLFDRRDLFFITANLLLHFFDDSLKLFNLVLVILYAFIRFNNRFWRPIFLRFLLHLILL